MKNLRIAAAALALALAPVGISTVAPAESPVTASSAEAVTTYNKSVVRCVPFSKPVKLYYANYRVTDYSPWEEFIGAAYGWKDKTVFISTSMLDFQYRPHPNYCNAFGYPKW